MSEPKLVDPHKIFTPKIDNKSVIPDEHVEWMVIVVKAKTGQTAMEALSDPNNEVMVTRRTCTFSGGVKCKLISQSMVRAFSWLSLNLTEENIKRLFTNKTEV